MGVLESVKREMDRARKRYGPFTSTHEAYGVLAEEVSELLDAIRTNDLGSIAEESTQVAAVAARLADQCTERLSDFESRSGVDGS